MYQLVKEIGETLAAAPLLALTGVMVLPDTCATIEYPHISGIGQKYKLWYDTYVKHYFRYHETPGIIESELVPASVFDGDFAWKIRNGLVHDSNVSHRGGSRGVLQFIYPNPWAEDQIHEHMRTIEEFDPADNSITHRMFRVHLGTFIEEVAAGVINWHDAARKDAQKAAKLDQLIAIRSYDGTIGGPPEWVLS